MDRTDRNASRIVVGVDPTDAGRAALRWALQEAVGTGAPVHAVRAWVEPSYGVYAMGAASAAVVDPSAAGDAQHLAELELKAARERVPGADGVDAHAVAVMGPSAQVLVNAGGGAAMVVVGARGAGPLARVLIGSVSTAVLHHTGCPVVVVHEGHDRTEPVQRVLVGVDHSAGSLAALRLAAGHARAHGAVLAPVRVHELRWVRSEDRHDDVGLEQNERRSLTSAAEAAGAAGLAVEPEVVAGHAAAGLLGLVREGDEIVVGSRGRGGFTSLLLGSTSTQVVQHARCPVLVVPTARTAEDLPSDR